MTTKALFYVIQHRLSENLPEWTLVDQELDYMRRELSLDPFSTEPIKAKNHVTTAPNTLIDDFMGDGLGALITPAFADCLPTSEDICLHPVVLDSAPNTELLFFQSHTLLPLLDFGDTPISSAINHPLCLLPDVDLTALAQNHAFIRPEKRPQLLLVRHDIVQALMDAGLQGFRCFDWQHWRYDEVSRHPYLSWDMMFGYDDKGKCAFYREYELRPSSNT